MLVTKAGGGDHTRRSKKNKRTCTDGRETTESLNSVGIHQDSEQGVWSELRKDVASNLSKSVVSVAVCDGSFVLFACSGIAIECQGCVIRFLTSASLVRALYDKTRERNNLKIEVRHEGNVVKGFLGKYDLDHGLAVVIATACLDVQAVTINHEMEMEFLPCSKVVAVGRGISGKLMATGGVLTHDPSESEGSEELMLSTCKIVYEAWEGGALFNIEGELIGMNLFAVNERTVFLPTSIIVERLEHFQILVRRSKFLERLQNLKADSVGKMTVTKSGGTDISTSSKKDNGTDDDPSILSNKDKIIDDLTGSLKKSKRTDDLTRSSKKNKRTCNGGGKITESLIYGHRDVLSDGRFEDLTLLGYPKKPIDMPNDDMILVNTFEDTFGDTYGGGVWSELSETVSSNISRNVVALASYYGKTRIFACTGFFIEWNGCLSILTSASLISDFVDDSKIFENLRIEVFLPTKRYKPGTLQHYNMHYNVALVSVKDFCVSHPIDIEHERRNRSRQLVSVGCCFKSCTLMAARGIHMNRLGKLDCKLLQYSTCKITKAGIGGPLVDFDGKFVGMSFYDKERTRPPFLSWDVILDVLAYFKTKRAVPEVGHDSYHISGVLDWTIIGDKSVCQNSWPVPKAFWCPVDSIEIVGKPRVPKRGRPRPPRVKIVDGIKYMYV
ncbi:unnamed protein product [Urochloa decumbens]|uniref:Uncharacterized protein n=1 Tax=Urochloa decumbens TaxID=240449 RepID=A0ABC8YLQ8_9POAL